MLRIGIVTVSDRAHSGEYVDKSGPAVEAELRKMISSVFEPVCRIVSDDKPLLKDTLLSLADSEGCSLIITTGGTGVAPRDITPEVTGEVVEKTLPGFGELMRAESLKKVPTAILSRQMAGVRGSSLIINLPGSPKAIAECLLAVFAAVPDCMDLIGGPDIEVNSDLVKLHRPHKKHKD